MLYTLAGALFFVCACVLCVHQKKHTTRQEKRSKDQRQGDLARLAASQWRPGSGCQCAEGKQKSSMGWEKKKEDKKERAHY